LCPGGSIFEMYETIYKTPNMNKPEHTGKNLTGISPFLRGNHRIKGIL